MSEQIDTPTYNMIVRDKLTIDPVVRHTHEGEGRKTWFLVRPCAACVCACMIPSV